MPKSISACKIGSIGGTKVKQDPKLVGEINEVNVLVNDVNTQALLDSGSCVSVIAESVWKENLKNELKSLDSILNIECADGQQLPYIGYIEAELKVIDGLPEAKPISCLFLVTADTKYSLKTPIILCNRQCIKLDYQQRGDCTKNYYL